MPLLQVPISYLHFSGPCHDAEEMWEELPKERSTKSQNHVTIWWTNIYPKLSKPHNPLMKTNLPCNLKAVTGEEFLHSLFELNTHFEWGDHRVEKAKESDLSSSQAPPVQPDIASATSSATNSATRHSQHSQAFPVQPNTLSASKHPQCS